MDFQKIYSTPCNKLCDLPYSKRALLAFAAGCLTTLSLPPFSILTCAFIGISLFYILLSASPAGIKSLATGWLYGFGYFSAGLWWIANALLVEGNPYSWVYPFAIAGLPALLAFFTAFCAYLIKKFASLNSASGFIFFVFIMAIGEWLRGHIFTGFPWNLYGHIWIDTLPLAQIAALCGVYGLTLFTLFWTALPGFLFHKTAPGKTKLILTLVALMTLVGGYNYGAHRLHMPFAGFHDDTRISIIQPNIAQEDKWNPDKAGENIQKLISLSKAALHSAPRDSTNSKKNILLIWPETALKKNAYEHPLIQEELQNLLARTNTEYTAYLLTGYLRYEHDTNTRDTNYYNSLAAFDRNLSPRFMYNKSHLVPFGEYIPLQNWLPIAPFVQLAGFTPGNGPVNGKIDSIPLFRPLVCYEIIFPALSAQQKQTGESRPSWILNITNDAWYGKSPGPHQHLAQARFRAIEQGTPVIRAANTGISALIDPLGRVMQATGLFEDAVISSPLPEALGSPPLYARLGDLSFSAIALFVALIFIFLKRRES